MNFFNKQVKKTPESDSGDELTREPEGRTIHKQNLLVKLKETTPLGVELHNKIITIGISVTFFIAGLATLADYGVNWDAVSHLSRGQAYLHYYLAGEKNYSNVRDWNSYREKEKEAKEEAGQDAVPRQRLYFQKTDTVFFSSDIPKDEIPRISIYQNVDRDFDYVMANYDYGHPHISDVLSAVFNFVLFQKLGFLNDIDSYRTYSVLLASLLVGLVFWWTASSYGRFAGLVAALSLALYPLFWSESHFNNEKDVPETVFWSFMLFSIWHGITGKSWKWILVSGVFFGLALGTKFNVLFSILVILPWIVFYFASHYCDKFSIKKFLKKYTGLILAAVTAPLLGIFIVIGTWPLFWSDPAGKIARIVDFYKTIGTTTGSIDERFIGPLGINTYAAQWILYTTPPVILFLAFMGIAVIVSRKFHDRQMTSLLFLLWLAVPILRVTWPGANIYGGVRQIMEYIPAMAILSGVGSDYILSKVKNFQFSIFNFQSNLNFLIFKHLNIKNSIKILNFKLEIIFLVLYCIVLLFPIIKLHPNENVYFNPLIGGLNGAKERDIPGWGVSFGAPYREAIEWINSNAELGSKLTLGHEILSNIPGIFIRPDIEYKSNRSGYLRQGEYVISLRFQGADKRSYFDMYLDKMIDSLHQITVDGVPILKIWKNDKKYLKPEWVNEGVLYSVKVTKKDSGLSFDVGGSVKLSRLEVDYSDSNCPELSWGYFMISQDGELWERVPGVLPEEVRIKTLGTQPSGGKFIEPFAGQQARYINFFVSPKDTCVTQVKTAKLYYFN